MHNYSVRQIVLTSIHIALCVVLPIAFHAIPGGGNVFCPMHIPVLLCGMLCGPISGLLCGIIGPLLSSIITGMPPAAMMPAMTVELALYGLMTGLLIRRIHSGNELRDIYIALIISMLMGRIASGLVKAYIFMVGDYSLQIWLTANFVTALPGVLLHLVIIPPVVYALQRAGLIAYDWHQVR